MDDSYVPVEEFRGDNLVDLASWRAAAQGSSRLFTFLDRGECEAKTMTFAALDTRARAIASRLRARSLPGDRALLLYEGGAEFVEAFMGCLYAGIVAVPAYPPDPTRLRRTLPRLDSIARDCQPRFVLTSSAIQAIRQPLVELSDAIGAIEWLATDEVDTALARGWEPRRIDPASDALLQYTSGSTSAPKGVLVTHGNLFFIERAIDEGFQHGPRSVGVGWLPLFHDMGLMGYVLQPLYVGFHTVLMSPLDFLQRPIRWLQAISRYRGTTAGGPNFAFELCARKVDAEARRGLDLSSWDLAFCGAEPVSPRTLARFSSVFEDCGFHPSAFYPCYGMAEATLIISGGRKSELPVSRVFSPRELEADRAAPTAGGSELVGCGAALLGQDLRIVDATTRQVLEDGLVGEIWVRGPGVARGYWQQDELTHEVFRATTACGDEGFLRTGDRGFLLDGELFVTGREKDMIIVRGRNIYPQDIEATAVASHRALRAGSAAAFSVEAEVSEEIALVLELRAGVRDDALPEIVTAIRESATKDHGVVLDGVFLIEAGQIPKTSSGKIQRRAARKQLDEGLLTVRHAWGRGSLRAKAKRS